MESAVCLFKWYAGHPPFLSVSINLRFFRYSRTPKTFTRISGFNTNKNVQKGQYLSTHVSTGFQASINKNCDQEQNTML